MNRTEPWRGFISGVLYSVQFVEKLDAETAARIARIIVTEPVPYLTPEQQYELLVDAMRSGAPLLGGTPQPHGERAFRAFVELVVNRLDALRPWPPLPFQPLPVSEWVRFRRGRPIARITGWYLQVQERLRQVFSSAEADREVLILRLRSGAEVALVTPWWHGSEDIALLQRDAAAAPEAVLAEFRDVTGLDPGLIIPLDASRNG